MWKIVQAFDENDVPLDKNRRERFLRKHPEAMAFLDAKMQQLAVMLNGGMSVAAAMTTVKWIHREQAGVHAIASREPPLRLYFLPLPDRQILLTLTIGDKNQQGKDVNETASWAKMILR